MQRRELNLQLNWVLLFAALMTFSTGLVTLLRLHMGPGAFASSAFGVDRLVWLNIHRLSAVLTLSAVTVHIVLHWRAFRSRLTRIFDKGKRRRVDIELLMYAAFIISALAGFVAWLVLEGSSPLLGPMNYVHLDHDRHHWIDVHHLISLVCLALVVHHAGHRLRFMVFPRAVVPK
jgi:cation transport ATPase